MKAFYQRLHDTIKSSDALAYRYFDEEHHYPEMYRNMCSINALLRDYSRKRVVSYTGKHFPAYCTIFSILLSGNTWIPVNPDLPSIRNVEILKLAEPDLIIADRKLPDVLAGYVDERGIEVRDLSSLIARPESVPFRLGTFLGDSIAYIMFTSGSTGTPKGVPMTHGNYINFVNNAMEILPFKRKEVFSDYHDFGFDISIFYLFCCILTESAFAPALKDSENIFALPHITANEITVLSSVPSLITRIKALKREQAIETPIRIMFLCGEPFPLDVLDYCLNNMQIEHVYNFYGLTETGVENFYHPCCREDVEQFKDIGFVPIGKPLKGNDILLSEKSELWISGCQITPGYLGGPSRDRFAERDGKRWFLTGDRVETRGDVYFCRGRLDAQVKVSGYRVELTDIEVHLRHIEGVDDAVCFVSQAAGQDFIVSALKAADHIDTEHIQECLRSVLPAYMVPRSVFRVGLMPVNKNGKIDRRALREQFERQRVQKAAI